MIKKLFVLLLLASVSVSLTEARPKVRTNGKKTSRKTEVEAADKPKPSAYDKLFGEKHEADTTGMIAIHKVKGKLYFEFPDSLLGREMLLGSTITEISDNYSGIVGSKSGDPRHILFTRSGENIQLRQINSDVTVDSDPSGDLTEAIRKNTLAPIIYNFKIEAYNRDSSASVFDVTTLFAGDDKEMSPFSDYGVYARYTPTRTFQKDRSFIREFKSFSDNVMIRSTLSYDFTVRRGKTTLIENKPLTAVMTRSLVLLDKIPYRPRRVDSRMAVFPTGKYLFSTERQKVGVIYYANRWRLEPSDSAAFARGEKVTPVKPIVFYIDSDFPAQWKPYIFEAVLQWNEPFERIGFKNAVEARPYPTDDPEFDPDNIKYSCIRYAPIAIENAMGPSWVDPRSGEILNASVYVYHDVIKLLNNWLFVQTAQTDERVRKVNIPEEVMGDGLRYVISHEVGHCLGYMHNMSASSVIPVDSLRSPSFTRQHGTTTSIMDYARFNYVAQPGDRERGVKLTPPRFGTYDYFAVKWLYTPVYGAKTIEEEYEITSKWITNAIEDPVYRYGKQQLISTIDPKSQTEDLGDDAIQASEYGIANLKYILRHMNQWLADEDKDYSHRAEIYDAIIMQYFRYIGHVYANVGGIYLNEKLEGDPVKAYESVPAEKQRRAIRFLLAQLRDMDWLDNAELMQNLPLMGSPKNTLLPVIVSAVVTAPDKLWTSAELAHGSAYTPQECRKEVYEAIWGPTMRGMDLTETDMMLQREYVKTRCASAGLQYTGSGSTPNDKNIDNFSLILPESLEKVAQRERALTCCYPHSAVTSHTEADTPNNGPISGYGAPRARYSVRESTEGDNFAEVLRLQSLLKSKASSANGSTAAHYKLLLRNIEKALTK